jgi:AraC-like DNA-binding protein
MYIRLLHDINFTAFFIFFNIIFYKGLTQPDMFLNLNEKDDHPKGFLLNEKKVKDILNRVLDYMKKEKPYLNSELTLNELAKRLGLSPRLLSIIINQKLNQNFFDFINRYRVEEAKKLLVNPDYQKYTILSIAFDAGFNSKSSFNLAFKRYENATPSQFRNLT